MINRIIQVLLVIQEFDVKMSQNKNQHKRKDKLINMINTIIQFDQPRTKV